MGLKGKIKECELTPAQLKVWEMTRAALLWHCPAFSHLFYNMMDKVGGKHVALFTNDPEFWGDGPGNIAATDGTSLILNPDTYLKLDLQERVFVAAHEILHCVYNHCGLGAQFRQRGKVAFPNGKDLPYIHILMNMAQDYVINDVLVESKVGKMPAMGCHDTKIGTAKDSAIDVYAKLYKDMEAKGKIITIGVGSGRGQGLDPSECKGFDQHKDPGTSQGKDPAQANMDRNEAEWGAALAAAMQSARLQGKLPAGLERALTELLNPKVDWREHIHSLFARKVGSGSFDWRRPDRRLIVRDIYAPGKSGNGAGLVGVAGDTSGSIGETELNMFFAEMAGLLDEVRPKKLLVAWCDAKVHRVDEAHEPQDLNEIRYKGAPGGGGTDFRPVFDWIANEGLEPDALVFLTDGYGAFPDRAPAYPVIWGSIARGPEGYPFGDVVEVPKQAA
jgi:predicted metal-dependent peptidase